MFSHGKRLRALETVVDALIEILNQKKIVTRQDIQEQIADDVDYVYIERGGTIYKVKRDEVDDE